MPSVSKDQQRAAGMALAAKRGEMKASELQGASKEMYDSMSEKQLEDFAKTKHDNLPEKVDEEIARMKDLSGLNEVMDFKKTVKYTDSLSAGLNDLEKVIGRVYEDSIMDWVATQRESEVKKLIKLIDDAIVKIESI